jgi:hypothetical protein
MTSWTWFQTGSHAGNRAGCATTVTAIRCPGPQRRYVDAAVTSVGVDKLPSRRMSQGTRVSDHLERGTWSPTGMCKLGRIRPSRVCNVSVV